MRSLAATILIIATGVMLALAPSFAHAATFEETIAKFSTDTYGDTEAAIPELTASGNPSALNIIEALTDGRLLFDAGTKLVAVQAKDGKLTNAATGEAIAGKGPAGLKPVRLNNRLRRALDGALGCSQPRVVDPSYSDFPGNFFPNSVAEVGFVNPAGGDFRLAPGSPYKGIATDGGDIGAELGVASAAELRASSTVESLTASSESSGGGCSLDPRGASSERASLVVSLGILILLAGRRRKAPQIPRRDAATPTLTPPSGDSQRAQT